MKSKNNYYKPRSYSGHLTAGIDGNIRTNGSLNKCKNLDANKNRHKWET
jgi:hypothetical protein